MLKIKDNVDLKELEKFGFEFNENKEYRNPYYNSKGCYVWCYNRVVEAKCVYYLSSFCLETVFDLIQAGLIEKVGENE